MSAMTLMIGDAVRRLTANYTEEEYREYLAEKPHRLVYCDGIGDYVDLDMNADKWYCASRLKYTSVKEIATDLQRVSDATGYGYDFLAEQYKESIKDGDTPEEAMETIAGISYERDW